MTTDDLYSRQIEVLKQVEAHLNHIAYMAWEQAISRAMHKSTCLSDLAAEACERAIADAVKSRLSQEINQLNQRLTVLESRLSAQAGLDKTGGSET